MTENWTNVTQEQVAYALTLRNICILNCFQAANFISFDISSVLFCFVFLCGEQRESGGGGGSGESTHLQPVWPWVKFRRRSHIWVEFVVGSRPCSERFFSGYSGFPLSSQNHHVDVLLLSLYVYIYKKPLFYLKKVDYKYLK